MAMHQITPQGAKLAALDPIWDRVRTEAEDIVRREPELASFIYSTVLHHDRLEDSVVHRLADDFGRNPRHRHIVRHRLHHHRARGDAGAMADLDIAENLRARPDQYAVAYLGMAILVLLAGAAQRDAVQNRDVVLDHSGLTAYEPGGVIQENPAANPGCGIDVRLEYRR